MVWREQPGLSRPAPPGFAIRAGVGCRGPWELPSPRCFRRPAAWVSLTVALTMLVPAGVSSQTVSSNADLSALTVSPTDIRDFASDTTSYTVGVANPQTSVTVTATTDDSAATLTIGGTTVQSGAGQQVSLNVGSNAISVVVTAENNTTKTYTITVNRCTTAGFCYKAVDNFDLTGHQSFPRGGWSDGETLWVVDAPARRLFAYDFATGARLSDRDISLLDQSGHGHQYRGMWSDGETAWVADASTSTILAYDLETGESAESLNINVEQPGSQDLWSDGETIYVSHFFNTKARILAFDRSTLQRDMDKDIVPESSVGIGNPRGVWSDGVTIWWHDGTDHKLYAFELDTGDRDSSRDSPVLARARNANGLWSDGETVWVGDSGLDEVVSYVMPVSGNDDLRTITVDDQAISVSDYEQDEYSYGVSNATTRVTVGAEARQLKAAASITSPTDADLNTGGHQVDLTTDSTEVTIRVTAQDGDTRDFILTIEKGLPGPPTITMLSPGARTMDVTWTAPSETGRGEISSYDIRHQTGDTVTVVSPAWSSGALTRQLTGLRVNQEYQVQVRAVNEIGAGPWSAAMTASTVGSTDATLSSLTVSPVDVKDFDPDDTHYFVRLANTVAQVTIRAETNHSGASIRIGGTTVNSGADHTVNTVVGRKIVTIAVTAEDPTSTKNYRLDVERGSTAPGEWNVVKDLAGLEIDKGIWSDGATLWGIRSSPHRIVAYNLTTGEEETEKGFALTGLRSPDGLVGHEDTLWVVESIGTTDKLVAYNPSTKARQESSDITLAAGLYSGAATDGVTIWVADSESEGLVAYDIDAKQAVSSKNINYDEDTTASNVRGLWSDGVTVWVVEGNDRDLQAYDLQTSDYDSAKNVGTFGSILDTPWGIWSDGTTMWVNDHVVGRAYSFNMRTSGNTDPRIRVNGATIPTISGETSHIHYVDSDVEQVTVAVEARQLLGSAEISSPEDADGVAEGHQVDLDPGENDVTFVVTAQDETSTEQTLVVDRINNATLTASPDDPDVQTRSTAVYDIEFQGNWDRDTRKDGVVGGTGGFTRLIGAVHSDAVTFLEEGEMASGGVESMAEEGLTATLKTEINTAINATAPTALAILEGSQNPIGREGSETLSSRSLTTDFPRVTLLSGIDNSPDWFVGVSGLSLLDSDGEWLESHTVKLFPWDAGTENGGALSRNNSATDPQGNIEDLRVGGIFTPRHLGTLTFTRRSLNTDGTVTLSSSVPRVGTELTAMLSDPDEPISDKSWQWARSSDQDSWADITSATSATYTPATADLNNYLRVTVTYTDSHGSGQKASAVPTSQVAEAANVAPMFGVETVSRSVNENLDSGAVVGAPVTATDPGDTLSYSLGGTDASSFSINSSTGQLSTASRFDYETKSSYTVTVTATDSAMETASVTVNVSVNNVEEEGTLSLSSATPRVGTALTATLSDDDVPASVSWVWKRSTSSTSFTDTISGANSASYTPVAGDVGRYLQVTVTYTDGRGSEQHSVSVVSTNQVVAAANVAPVFDSSTVSRSVDENLGSGAVVGDPVTATDPGDTLRYSLGGTDASSFSIDSATGQLSTAAVLDYETKSSYQVTVTATDSGDLTASVTVNISVTEVEEAGTVSLSSTTPRVHAVLTAEVSDSDGSVSNESWVWARSTNKTSWTDITGATTESYTPVAADLNNYLRATVTYRDAHGAGQEASGASDSVVAANVAPVFGASTVSRSVAENQDSGTEFGDPVTATDHDRLSYSLGGTDASSFSIDADSGQLSTAAVFDLETKSSYQVTVTATDRGDLTASVTVNVTVTDANDPGTVSLSSTTPRVHAVLTAEVSDMDGSVTDESWVWRSSTSSTSFTDDAIDGATSASYTPVAADVGKYLQVTVTYRDAHGTGNTAEVVSDNVVAANVAPVFGVSTVSRSVAENLGSGTEFGDPVTATDHDVLSYSLGGTDASSFAISSSTGQLSTAAVFDFETETSYQVTVTATDRGNLTASVTVNISVTNANDPGTVALSSATPRVHAVLTAEVSDLDGSVSNESWVWARSTNKTSWTDITGATSVSYTPVAADLNNYLRATVTYRDAHGAGQEASGVSDSVVAANVAPVFGVSTVSRSVAENLGSGTEFGDPVTATDHDVLSYSLGGTDASSFAINSSTGQLSTAAVFDFETETSYQVTVTATDRGNLTASVTVNVTVTDANDPGTVALSSATPRVHAVLTAEVSDLDGSVSNESWVWARSTNKTSWTDITGATSESYTPVAADLNNYLRATVTYRDAHGAGNTAVVVSDNVVAANVAPVFSASPVSRSVAENLDSGTEFGDPVTATDHDVLSYSLGGTDASSFSIDADSGQLSTAAMFDYEDVNSYSVTVTATDRGDLTANVTVNISVTDANDPGTVALSSATPRVHAVLTAEVSDLDGSVSNESWVWARSTNKTSWTDITGATSESYTPVAADLNNYLRATVTYRDAHGAGQEADEVSDSVVAANVAPSFGVETVSRSVAENLGSGAVVGDPVAATDHDVLSYSLGGTDASSFSIDADSGQLKTAAMFDYEDVNSYSVTVTATDRGDLTDSVTVNISVTNADDAGTLDLSSSTPQVETELTAEVSDPDDSVTVVSWVWARSTNKTSWTDITGATSASYTPVAADLNNYLRVTVTYTDGHGSTQHSVSVVSANTVVAAANKAPSFSEDTVSRSVDENQNAGAAVGDPVTATDPGDTLTYSVGGTDESSFSINSSTGQLSTKVKLNYETKSSYTVTVTATDTGGLDDRATVNITVNNVDEAGSVSFSSPTTPRVHAVLTAELSDPDGSVTGHSWQWAYYSGAAMDDPDPDVDASWTDITAATTASYTPAAGDLGKYLRVEVEYRDGHGSGKSVKVMPSDVVAANEAPVFSPSTVSRSVDENQDSGTAFGDPVTASDHDTVTYSLTGGDTTSFAIDSTTGQLTTAAMFDYEDVNSYSVTVTATDQGDLTGEVTVNITVNNADDAGTLSLSSSTPREHVVLTAELSDDDGSVSGETWQWARNGDPETDPWIDIEGATSASYTPGADDEGKYLRAEVAYRDGHGPGKSVRVQSDNPVAANVAPEFSDDTVSLSVDENQDSGTAVGDPVTADDHDPLTYSLTDGATASFAIGSTTGQLTTTETFNYEKETSYEVTVTATDRGGLKGMVKVTITVNNQNEDGTLSLSSSTPQVDTELTAMLSDPDGSVSGQSWQWARNENPGTDSWVDISGATSAAYTPESADLDHYLRVTVEYTDDTHTTTHELTAESANQVREAPVTNEPPTFGGASVSLEVEENVPMDTVVGTVRATDPDPGDTLLHWIREAATFPFQIHAFNGRLTTNGKIDYETQSSYELTVVAMDPSLAEAEITVTITVTDVATVLSLSSTRPSVGSTLVATLTDPGQGIVGWQWARSPDSTGPWVDIGGATAASYPVVSADGGNYLQVTVTYTNDGGESTQLSTATGQRVTQPVSNPPPSNPPSGPPPGNGGGTDDAVEPVEEETQSARSADVYLDIEPNTWYEPAVTWMVQREITRGCGPDTFCPGRQVTRQEFVTFLWRAAGRPSGSFSGADAFADVGGGYADQAIGWAASIGVTSGCTTGEFGDEDWGFCPEDPISRAEIATLLFRFVEATWAEEVDFEDVPSESYYRSAVGWMSYFEITSGCQSGMFCPSRLASRAEVATLIYRVAIRPHSWGAGNTSFLSSEE